MKIAASLIALAAAQAPPESKTCPDCKDWHGAANTLVAANPNLVKEWAQAVAKEQCQVIWDNDAVCHYFVEGGFVNWVDSWRERMDANSWCSAYAMCSKNDAYASEPAADSCTSCKNFFGNYLNIAKHNPKQFHDIFIQVGKDVCHGVYQEPGCIFTMNDPRIEKMIVDKLSQVSNADDLCKAMTFC